MHLICINHNNIINKTVFLPKKGRSNTLYMCLDIHAKFCGDRPPSGPRPEGGVKLTPPPPPQSKTCSQKAQLK